jgi:hypothetical protein
VGRGGGRPVDDFSEDELREYADEHVKYEITQFVRGAQAIDAACAELFPMNFAIEVFALHLRNLLDFFARVTLETPMSAPTTFTRGGSRLSSTST